MKCVVPLAGPDLWTDAYGLRPLYSYEGRPLIVSTLKSRSWAAQLSGEDYVFVIRDIDEAVPLFDLLAKEWPGCRFVKLSHLTGGGMLSALAGVSLLTVDEPIIVDLADILVQDRLDIFPVDPTYGVIIPVFDADEDCYSYLIEEGGEVIAAAEKVVVSRNASAGIYIFRDRSVFMAAAAYCLANADTVTYRGMFFVCPMVNGIISQGLRVSAPRVRNIVPIGKIFH